VVGTEVDAQEEESMGVVAAAVAAFWEDMKVE
jgi:hypothetical protein